jgi:uncharacterized protein
MEFLNPPVSVEALPKVEEVPLIPAEHRYLKVLRLQWLIIFLVLLIAISALVVFVEKLRAPVFMTVVGVGWVVLAAASFWLQEKSFRVKAYAIRERDVIYQTGLIFRNTYTCPFNRIQNTTVAVGPLERKFGLATLILYTAGTNAADVHIPGLKEETARSLKEWITKKIADEPATAL